MPGIDAFLDLIFPPRCIGCRSFGRWICDRCLAKAPLIAEPVCPKCGRPMPGPALCGPCRAIPLHFSRARAVYDYDGVIKQAIHRFKYRGLTALAPVLAGVICQHLERFPTRADMVIAVPLHRDRLRERGYNQSELLAAEVARSLGLPFAKDVVERSIQTRPQVGLGAVERHANVHGAFHCNGDPLPGSRVLLIDDVYTTGATLSDCARALKEAGAASVQALAVARGN